MELVIYVVQGAAILQLFRMVTKLKTEQVVSDRVVEDVIESLPDEESLGDDESLYKKEELTPYELECLEREDEFDRRIKRLNDELGETQHVMRRGINAEELHPLVHNLPHNIIKTRELPDVEYSE